MPRLRLYTAQDYRTERFRILSKSFWSRLEPILFFCLSDQPAPLKRSLPSTGCYVWDHRLNCQNPLTFLSTNVQHVQVVSFTYFFFFFFVAFVLCQSRIFFNVARPSCDVAARDHLWDRKRMVIELVQSSEFNRLRHVQSIGCNSLELNRILCDRLIWDM